jgi:hypothetical protein
MEIFKEGDSAAKMVLYPEDVESAVRQFICTCHPEFSQGWILNPYYNVGTVLFAGTKGDEPHNSEEK